MQSHEYHHYVEIYSIGAKRRDFCCWSGTHTPCLFHLSCVENPCPHSGTLSRSSQEEREVAPSGQRLWPVSGITCLILSTTALASISISFNLKYSCPGKAISYGAATKLIILWERDLYSRQQRGFLVLLRFWENKRKRCSGEVN